MSALDQFGELLLLRRELHRQDAPEELLACADQYVYDFGNGTKQAAFYERLIPYAQGLLVRAKIEDGV